METEEKLQNTAIRKLCQQGRFSEALAISRRFVDTLCKTYGENHYKVAWVLQNMTGICRQLNDYDQAFKVCRHAIKILETLGNRPKDLATLLNNYALLHAEIEHLNEAEINCRRAVQVLEESGDTGTRELGAYWDNLAMILSRQGRFSDALNCCERALRIFERTLGDAHPKVTTTIRNLAELRARGKQKPQ
jgi:tetratricopeptide (TPR) repeat protein